MSPLSSLLAYAPASLECQGGLATYAWAFGQGVLVDFTPCVYPLIPITVSVFGAKGVSRPKALGLAAAYVLGMATLYTTLGVLIALFAGGAGFGAWLGNPVVVLPLVAILLALAASMFGAFDIQLPGSLQTKLSGVGGAGPLGAFMMGLVSGFISAPCTGPVLLGLLTYIAGASAGGGAGAVVYGGSLLFTYALGMGTLFFAVALGASLFKPGPWMEHIKSVFGVALLVMAFYFLRPLSPALKDFTLHPTAGLWIGLAALVVGIGIGAIHKSFKYSGMAEKLRKGAGVALATVGAAVMLNNILYVELTANWTQVGSFEEMQAAVTRAREAGKPVLVDFGASWCNPCHELEAKALSHPDVEPELAKYELVKVDVSDPSEEQDALQGAFHARELPSVVVYDPEVIADGFDAVKGGDPIPDPDVHVNRVMEADEFLAELEGRARTAARTACATISPF